MVELSGIMQGMQLLALIFLVALFCVVLAMSADLVSGWRKAEVRGEVHTSYAFSRTLTKSLIYFGLLIVAGCIDLLVHFVAFMFHYCYFCPCASIVVAIILCIVEGWSIKEKADQKTRNLMNNAVHLIEKTLTHDQVVALLTEAMKKANNKSE